MSKKEQPQAIRYVANLFQKGLLEELERRGVTEIDGRPISKDKPDITPWIDMVFDDTDRGCLLSVTVLVQREMEFSLRSG